MRDVNSLLPLSIHTVSLAWLIILSACFTATEIIFSREYLLNTLYSLRFVSSEVCLTKKSKVCFLPTNTLDYGNSSWLSSMFDSKVCFIPTKMKKTWQKYSGGVTDVSLVAAAWISLIGSLVLSQCQWQLCINCHQNCPNWAQIIREMWLWRIQLNQQIYNQHMWIQFTFIATDMSDCVPDINQTTWNINHGEVSWICSNWNNSFYFFNFFNA